MPAGVLCTEHALTPDTKAVILETWSSGSAYCCTIRVSKEEAYMRWWIWRPNAPESVIREGRCSKTSRDADRVDELAALSRDFCEAVVTMEFSRPFVSPCDQATT